MNTSKPITVVHSDTTITYNEGENKWTFTLRGRDRSADSLAKAKEFIDKPLPPEKAKPFEKIPAWSTYRDSPTRGEVTGFTEEYGTPAVWFVSNKTRNKIRAHYIFPSNAKNDRIFELVNTKEKQINTIRFEIRAALYGLKKLVIPKDE